MTERVRTVEDHWLEYAVDVVIATDHDCHTHDGGCLEPGGNPSFRWPGYLGERFQPGSLLLVGNVHRDFGSNDTPPWVSALLVETTRRLQLDPVNHRQQ